MEHQHDPVAAGDPSSVIATLFKTAQEQGDVSYTYALLRVGGIDGRPDPLLALAETVTKEWRLLSGRQKHDVYCRLASLEDPLALIANLLNAATKAAYQPFPFANLVKETPTGFLQPDSRACVEALIARAEIPLGGVVASALRRCYGTLLRGGCDDSASTEGDHSDDYPPLFWGELYRQYWKARKAVSYTH